MSILFTQWSAPTKVLPILKWPDDKKLHEKSVDVTEFNEDLLQLASHMFATMEKADGIGLAAPQTGNMINMIALRLEKDKPLILVNPVITHFSEEMFKFNEGCLSVPGFFEDRERPEKIILVCNDVVGMVYELQFSGVYAFAIQHEIDHLLGKLFVDGSSLLKRQIIKGKMRKARNNK